MSNICLFFFKQKMKKWTFKLTSLLESLHIIMFFDIYFNILYFILIFIFIFYYFIFILYIFLIFILFDFILIFFKENSENFK